PTYATPATFSDTDPKRVAFLRSVGFAGNNFSYHFAFVPGLGVISARQTAGGFTTQNAWGLNPNDTRWDGSSLVPDYIGAVMLKAPTRRNGAPVSVYNYNRIAGTQAGTGQLNDCERDGSQTFDGSPDLASTGQIEGIFVNMMVSETFGARCGAWTQSYG